MKDAGADQYTFHLEATDKPMELIKQIKDAGMKVINDNAFFDAPLQVYLSEWLTLNGCVV